MQFINLRYFASSQHIKWVKLFQVTFILQPRTLPISFKNKTVPIRIKNISGYLVDITGFANCLFVFFLIGYSQLSHGSVRMRQKVKVAKIRQQIAALSIVALLCAVSILHLSWWECRDSGVLSYIILFKKKHI